VSRCDDVAKVVEPYLSGQIDDETAQKLAEHINACAVCRYVHDAHRFYRFLRDRLPDTEAPPDLRRRIEQIVAWPRAGRPARFSWVKPFGALVLIAALAAAVLLIILPRPGGSPSARAAAFDGRLVEHLLDHIVRTEAMPSRMGSRGPGPSASAPSGAAWPPTAIPLDGRTLTLVARHEVRDGRHLVYEGGGSWLSLLAFDSGQPESLWDSSTQLALPDGRQIRGAYREVNVRGEVYRNFFWMSDPGACLVVSTLQREELLAAARIIAAAERR